MKRLLKLEDYRIPFVDLTQNQAKEKKFTNTSLMPTVVLQKLKMQLMLILKKYVAKMNKRKIKLHKGGRDARLPSARISTDDLKALKEILKRRAISFADWIIEKIKEDF